MWKSAAAAACAFVASLASRRLQQRRSGSVLMRYVPSTSHRPKQKVLRRLEPFGQIPAWSQRTLMKKKVIKAWRTRQTPKLSHWGRQMIEKQRVRYHYNLKDSSLKKYMERSFRKGIEWPIDNLMQQLESRLDNYVWRVGLAPTMAGARHFVRGGHIQYISGNMTGWKTINVPSCRLKVGDKIRVSAKEHSQNTGKLNHEAEGPIPLPAHITWDRETMVGSYDDVCDIKEIGINVTEGLLLLWCSGPRGIRRRHFRYFEGTNKVIPKRYNGGRIRPTPENIINMKKGLGTYRHGRSRPPCLWGRRRPLNNPYESGKRNNLF